MKERKSGSPLYFKALEDMADMHERKSMDYGSNKDVMANLRASEDYGIPAWVGISIRINDKEQRIRSFLEKGKLANESLEDALIDHAVYSVLRLVMYREEQAKKKAASPTVLDIPAPLPVEHRRQQCNICGDPNCPEPNQKH